MAMFRKKGLGKCAALGMAVLFPLPAEALTVTVNDFQAGSFTSAGGQQIMYRLFVPKNYNPATAYPIMLTLHGAGERGTNNSSQLMYPFSIMWGDDSVQSPHPCFVLSPQCPNNSTYGWVNTPWGNATYNYSAVPISADLQAVVELLDSVSRQYRIDTLREYVSGMSMGGYASWYLAMRFPTRFAAVVPVCGAGDTARAASIRNVPVWAFHAADDPTVPVRGSRDMIAAMQRAGGTPVYTEYPASMGIGHSSWIPAAQNPALVPWVFGQARTPVPIFWISSRTRRDLSFHQYFLRIDGLGRVGGEFPALNIFP